MTEFPQGIPDLQCACKGNASHISDNHASSVIRGETKEVMMGKVVRCSCGIEIRGGSERELIARVQQHAKEAHGLELTDEQVLAMAEIEQ